MLTKSDTRDISAVKDIKKLFKGIKGIEVVSVIDDDSVKQLQDKVLALLRKE